MNEAGNPGSSFGDLISWDHSSLTGSGTSIKKTVEQVRIKFDSGPEFLFFCLGFVMQPGMFRQFVVYDANKNVGLFHHVIVYIFAVLPLLYMQLIIGQYTQVGPINFRYINPLTHGLSYMFILACILEIVLSATYLIDSMMYLLLSMQKHLEWMECRDEYEEVCLGTHEIEHCSNCDMNNTVLSAFLYWSKIFMKHVDLDPKELHYSLPHIQETILSAICWSSIFISLIYSGRGLKKVIRIGVIIVDICVLLLLGVALLTAGSTYCLSLLLTLTVENVMSISTWLQTIKMNIRWLSLGKAIYILMGNFLVPGSQTSVLSIGLLILAYIHAFVGALLSQIAMGIVLYRLNIPVRNLTSIIDPEFPRKNYIVIPQAFGLMAAPQLWSTSFFFVNLLLLYMNTIIYITVIEKSLTEAHPALMSYRKYLLAIMCIAFFFISMPAIAEESFMVVDFLLFLHYDLEYLTICMMTICVSYIYGVQKLSDDIHFFSGSQPPIFYKVCWYILPAILTLGFFQNMSIIQVVRDHFHILRIIIFTLFILPLPISAICELVRHLKQQNLVGLVKPYERWGPADPEERHLRKIFNPREETRSRRRYDTCQHNCLLHSKVYKKVISEEDKFRHEMFGVDVTATKSPSN